MIHNHRMLRVVPFAAAVLLALAVAGPARGASPTTAVARSGMGGSTYVAGAGLPDGIDVSHWQGFIRWHKVAAAGVDFAIAKATDGTWMVDPRYARNEARAEANGIFFTAYHYARPTTATNDAVKEADFFVKNANLTGDNLVPALDIETSGGLDRHQLRGWVLSWLDEVDQKLGVKPMIYTSPSFWAYYLGNTQIVARRGYQVVWVAHWGVYKPRVPAKDWNKNGWTYWQWTSQSHVAGIYGHVDRDWFHGDDLTALTIGSMRAQSPD